MRDGGLIFVLNGFAVIVVVNALVAAAFRIVRARAFGKGNVVGATPVDMQVFRKGVACGAFVPNHSWSNARSRRASFLRRWFVFFPLRALSRLRSLAFWGWCGLQTGVLSVFWILWPEMKW